MPHQSPQLNGGARGKRDSLAALFGVRHPLLSMTNRFAAELLSAEIKKLMTAPLCPLSI